MEKQLLLKIVDLKVNYGPVAALKGINLDVYQGDVVAILGANGAGKTTTLRTISGIVEASAGQILYKGQDITKMAVDKITRLGIIQSPEGRQIFGDLTVEENLKIGAFTVKDKQQIQKNFERAYRYFPILKERKHQSAQTLSGGEQQMLAIARALMGSPELLLLDEPSLGLAPLLVTQILQIVKEISQEGVTVIIVEQNAAQTLKISDYGYVIELGKVSTQGDAKDLAQDEMLIEAYLGK